MRYLYTAFLFILLGFAPTFAAETKIFESVVKVHGPVVGGYTDYGSGLCVNLDDDYIYISTNKHVVGNGKKAFVRFYREGYESKEIEAEIAWTAYKKNQPVDIALLKVERKKINWTPPIVELALDGKIYSVGETIMTIGCPEAGWPKAVQGHIVKSEGGTYLLTPAAKEGQSGSVLLNKDGTKVIGIIAWSNDKHARAMNLETIKLAVEGKPCKYYLNQDYSVEESDYVSVEKQVGFLNRRGNCPPGGCNPNQQPPQNRRLRPNKDTEDTNKPSDGGLKIFPTFPGDQEIPEDDKPEVKPAEVKPEQPKVDDSRVVALETKVNDLVSKFDAANKTNTADHQKFAHDIAEVEIKIGNVGKVDTSNLATKDDVTNAVKDKADVSDVVTPGNLEQKLKSITDAVTPGKLTAAIAPTITELKQSVVKVDEFNNLKDQLNNAKADLSKQIVTAITGQNSQIVGAFEKSIVATKESDINNTVNEYGTTGLAALIPTIGAIIIGFMFRNKIGGQTNNNTLILAKTIAEAIKGHLGGVVSTAPFPKTPVKEQSPTPGKLN